MAIKWTRKFDKQDEQYIHTGKNEAGERVATITPGCYLRFSGGARWTVNRPDTLPTGAGTLNEAKRTVEIGEAKKAPKPARKPKVDGEAAKRHGIHLFDLLRHNTTQEVVKVVGTCGPDRIQVESVAGGSGLGCVRFTEVESYWGNCIWTKIGISV